VHFAGKLGQDLPECDNDEHLVDSSLLIIIGSLMIAYVEEHVQPLHEHSHISILV
jgi:hypothetical protein